MPLGVEVSTLVTLLSIITRKSPPRPSRGAPHFSPNFKGQRKDGNEIPERRVMIFSFLIAVFYNITMDNILVIEKDFDLREIIDGEEYMPPSPFGFHQRIILNLYDIISPCIKQKKLGKIYTAPLDVILDEPKKVILQPDLLFIKNENLSIVKQWIYGAPNMVCEIVSKSSIYRDTVKKKKVCEKYKIPEYWLVYPEYSTIEIYTLENNEYELYSMATDDGVVKSKVIDGLEFEISSIFTD